MDNSAQPPPTTPDGTPNRRHPSRTRPAAMTIPDITDPNEIVIVYTSDTDDLGRRQFFAFWLDNNIGAGCDQHGVRGQVFYTEPATFIARDRAAGHTIREIDPTPRLIRLTNPWGLAARRVAEEHTQRRGIRRPPMGHLVWSPPHLLTHGWVSGGRYPPGTVARCPRAGVCLSVRCPAGGVTYSAISAAAPIGSRRAQSVGAR